MKGKLGFDRTVNGKMFCQKDALLGEFSHISHIKPGRCIFPSSVPLIATRPFLPNPPVGRPDASDLPNICRGFRRNKSVADFASRIPPGGMIYFVVGGNRGKV